MITTLNLSIQDQMQISNNHVFMMILSEIANYANNNGIKQYNLYDDEASNISQRIAHKFIKKYYE